MMETKFWVWVAIISLQFVNFSTLSTISTYLKGFGFGFGLFYNKEIIGFLINTIGYYFRLLSLPSFPSSCCCVPKICCTTISWILRNMFFLVCLGFIHYLLYLHHFCEKIFCTASVVFIFLNNQITYSIENIEKRMGYVLGFLDFCIRFMLYYIMLFNAIFIYGVKIHKSTSQFLCCLIFRYFWMEQQKFKVWPIELAIELVIGKVLLNDKNVFLAIPYLLILLLLIIKNKVVVLGGIYLIVSMSVDNLLQTSVISIFIFLDYLLKNKDIDSKMMKFLRLDSIFQNKKTEKQKNKKTENNCVEKQKNKQQIIKMMKSRWFKLFLELYPCIFLLVRKFVNF